MPKNDPIEKVFGIAILIGGVWFIGFILSFPISYITDMIHARDDYKLTLACEVQTTFDNSERTSVTAVFTLKENINKHFVYIEQGDGTALTNLAKGARMTFKKTEGMYVIQLEGGRQVEDEFIMPGERDYYFIQPDNYDDERIDSLLGSINRASGHIELTYIILDGYVRSSNYRYKEGETYGTWKIVGTCKELEAQF